jgi:hypothetical protein
MVSILTVIIAAIVEVLIAVAALVIALMAVLRRRRLRQRAGWEHDRLPGQRDSTPSPKSELAGGGRRAHRADVPQLSSSVKASYAPERASLQRQLAYGPTDSVEKHATALHHGWAAGNSNDRPAAAAAGTASTEELRLTMINYRAPFDDLVDKTTDAEIEGIWRTT